MTNCTHPNDSDLYLFGFYVFAVIGTTSTARGGGFGSFSAVWIAGTVVEFLFETALALL